MQECFPIVFGVALGILLANIRLPVLRRAVLVVMIAACATIASGEFRLSWSFLALDVLEVGFASLAGFLAVKYGGRYLANRP